METDTHETDHTIHMAHKGETTVWTLKLVPNGDEMMTVVVKTAKNLVEQDNITVLTQQIKPIMLFHSFMLR